MLPLMALFDVGMKVLDKFIPDPEAKAKAQQELLKMQQEGKLAELQADMNEQNNISDRSCLISHLSNHLSNTFLSLIPTIPVCHLSLLTA